MILLAQLMFLALLTPNAFFSLYLLHIHMPHTFTCHTVLGPKAIQAQTTSPSPLLARYQYRRHQPTLGISASGKGKIQITQETTKRYGCLQQNEAIAQ